MAKVSYTKSRCSKGSPPHPAPHLDGEGEDGVPCYQSVGNEVVQEKRAFALYDKLRSIFSRKPSYLKDFNSFDIDDLLFLLPDFFMLLLRLVKDTRVEKHKKIFISCLIGYVLLPFDIIPDFIPTAGYLDDFTLVVLGLDIIFTDINEKVISQNWSGKQNVIDLVRFLVDKIEKSLYKSLFKTVKTVLKAFAGGN